MNDVDIRFTRDVRELIARAIADSGGNEVFFVGNLDGEGIVVDVEVASRGHESAVPVISSAVDRAEVLIHNHPSGNVLPSLQDDTMTQRLGRAAGLMDVRLLDHIILSEDDYYSYADKGRIAQS